MEDSEESLLKAIYHYQSGLERYLQRHDEAKMLHNLGRLKRLPIKLNHLERTGVGRTVNSLRKVEGSVGETAKALVARWKEMVMEEENKSAEVSSAEDIASDVAQDEEESPRNTSKTRDHKESKTKSSSHTSKPKNHDDSNLKENRHKKTHKKRSHSSSEEGSSSADSDSNVENRKRIKSDEVKEKKESSKESHKNVKDSKHEAESKSDEHKRHKSSDERRHKHKHEKKDTSQDKKSKDEGSKREKDKKKDHKTKDHREKHDKHKSKSSEKSNEKSSKSHSDKREKASEKSSKSSKSTPCTVTNGIGSESGTSFEAALGMCEPSLSKKRKQFFQAPVSREQSPRRSPLSDNDLLVEMPLPKEPLNKLDITITRPAITPHYRPLGLPIDDQPRRILTDDEALSKMMTNKNQRTKVFSGNKVGWSKVPSLFDICVRILQDNLDAMEYTGGVPYSILKPILEKASANQLYMMEQHNPYLIDDSDELWKLHCQKEFRNKSREELETWRDMYMRCLDEREAKLLALTANIKQSQDKSLPVRTTKLAYVDSVAKPPRNVARKQAKNDTGGVRQTPSTKLALLATKGEASKVAVPNPGARAAERSSNHQMKPKKAPLMAKTLSLFKNRFRR